VKAPAVIGVTAAAILLGVAFQGCSTVTANGEPCYPGDYVYCACDDHVQGYSECTPDAGGYGPCDCSGINLGEVDASPPPCSTDGGKQPFGCPCPLGNEQCAGDPSVVVCHDFQAKGGLRCTAQCPPTTNCPATSGGCNMMGECMP
jgi:hypothetical protein